MVSALALWMTVLAPSIQVQGLYQKVVPTPTGKNGYEELVMAAAILDQTRFSQYFGWSRQLPDESPKLTDQERGVIAELKGKSVLQRYRLIVERNSRVRDLLLQAAKKPIFEPRTGMDFETLFPEYAGFKNIVKFIQMDVYVAFADGQGGRGVDEIATGLDVFDRTGRGVLISYLVGVACEGILLASVEEHLTRLSQRDAKRLEDMALAILGRHPAIRDSIETEFKFSISGLDKALSDVKAAQDLAGLFDENVKEKASATLKSLTSGDLSRLKEAVKKRFAESGQKMVELFDKSESDWAAYKEDEPPPPDWSSAIGIADALSDAITPVFTQVGIAASRNRTQVRLLGLVGGVIRYRWENTKLPDKLEDAVGSERIHDPLSSLPFEYKRDGTGGFAVVSKGTKETGEIALRYRRPEGKGDPGPP